MVTPVSYTHLDVYKRQDVENKKYKLTPQMLGVLSEDKQFAFEYMKFTEPLMKKIEEAEVDSIISDEKGIKMCIRDRNSGWSNDGRYIISSWNPWILVLNHGRKEVMIFGYI